MIKLKKWTGKNGKTRVYVNGLGYGINAYVVDGGETGHYSEGYPEIVVRSDSGLSGSDVDRIVDDIDAFVRLHRKQLENGRAPTFSDYLSLAQ
jgi:hypothetical protein